MHGEIERALGSIDRWHRPWAGKALAERKPRAAQRSQARVATRKNRKTAFRPHSRRQGRQARTWRRSANSLTLGAGGTPSDSIGQAPSTRGLSTAGVVVQSAWTHSQRPNVYSDLCKPTLRYGISTSLRIGTY